jgi:hypothetical protein
MALPDDFSRATNRRMGKAMIALGVLLVLSTLCFGLRKAMLYRHALHASGTVSEVRGGSMAALEFLSAGGSMVRVPVQGRMAARVGDPVDVLYLAAQPEQARVNQVLQLWGIQLLGACVGTVLLVLGWATVRGHVSWGPR